MATEYIKYIPKDIIVGLQNQSKNNYYSRQASLFKSNESSCAPGGIVVCKFGEYKWTNDSGFKYVSGYNRGNHKDISKNIKRDLDGSRFDLKNVPTAGFKILQDHFNVYSESGYTNIHNFPILDPRGFVIGISRKQFINLIKNVTIKDGIIQDELVYCWEDNKNNSFDVSIKFPFLLSVKSPEYEGIKKESEEIIKQYKPSISIKSKKDLTPGNVYTVINKSSINNKLKFLYLGKTNILNNSIWKQIYLDSYVYYNPLENEILKRIKIKNTNNYNKSYKSYYYYSSINCPWENSNWQKLMSDSYYNLYKETDCFISLDQDIYNVILNLFNENKLIYNDDKFFNSHVPLSKINDIISYGIKTNIQLNKIIDEEDPKSSNFEDFENNKNFYNYMMNFSKNLSLFVKNSLNITIKNFPYDFSENKENMIDEWYNTPYLPNPFYQDCTNLILT